MTNQDPLSDSKNGELSTLERRSFLQGLAALAIGGIVLCLGAVSKLYQFFFNVHLDTDQQREILSRKIESLKSVTKQDELQLERDNSETLFVANLAQLSDTKGKYFLDYQMNPALAFLDKNGLPLLISAKCTHLGCTVGADANSQGKILCPCHMSYFDIHSGEPNAGSPAKAPLPHFGWTVRSKQGQVVAQKLPDGTITRNAELRDSEEYGVFISKRNGETT